LVRSLLILIVLTTSNLFGQSNSPDLSNGIMYITKYVSSSYYDSLKQNHSDLDLIDSIYYNTIKYYNNNYSEALLALTIACLPIEEFDITIPIVKIPLSLHVPIPKSKLHKIKNKNLPKQFLFNKKLNDVDKLSHFFGNAFFSYNLQNAKLTTLLGYFVEYFEALFKVDGALDKRDIFINRLGINFGLELNFNKFAKPSEYFKKLNNYNE
jgi:hypothetical protein